MEVIHFDEIESTQRYAKDLVKAGKTDFIVVADSQNCGTGRHGRVWVSPKGGLWFSFVCTKPDNLRDEFVYFVTLAVGVCVKNLLKEVYGCELEIKWPNDVLLNEKKVCGILCEKVGEQLICGIGVNTNVSVNELREYNLMATSFLGETGTFIDNGVLMDKIVGVCLEKIETVWEERHRIVQELNEVLAYKGEARYLTYLNGEAEIVAVDNDGHLIVCENGERKSVLAGEVL